MTRKRFALIPIAIAAALAALICVLCLFGAPSVASAEDVTGGGNAAKDGETVSVTFVVDGEQYAVEQVITGGTVDFSSIKDPVKKSDKKYTYSFGGWYLDEKCTAKFDANSAMWADTTLYAKFGRVHKLGIGEAAVDAVLGFVIVVGVLALLVGIFYISGRLFRTKALSKENLFEFKKQNVACEPAYVPEITDDGGELETVAAIAAAISAVLEDENGGQKPEFVIRRITRKK